MLKSVKQLPAPGVECHKERHRHRPCTMPWCWAASNRRPAIPYTSRPRPCCWCRDLGTAELAYNPCRLRRVAQGPAIVKTATRTSARRRTTASARSWLAHHPRVHAGQGQTLALIERVNRSRGPALPSTTGHGS